MPRQGYGKKDGRKPGRKEGGRSKNHSDKCRHPTLKKKRK